jgi:formamidopyrimidine-DNA glycosylase
MLDKGGRDTETDLFGEKGGYHTILSKNTYGQPCPKCGGEIIKENYMGGSVYYCPSCQPLI